MDPEFKALLNKNQRKKTLFKFLSDNKEVINSDNLSFILRRVRRYYPLDEEAHEEGMKILGEKIEELNAVGLSPYHISGILWSWSVKLPGEIRTKLVDSLCEKIDEATFIDVSQALNGLAKQKYDIESGNLEIIGRKLLSKDCGMQSISNSLWGFARMSHNLPQTTYYGFLENFMHRIEDAKPIAISQLFDFAAKKMDLDGDTVETLIEHALSMPKECTSRVLAKILLDLSLMGSGKISKERQRELLSLFLAKINEDSEPARIYDIQNVLSAAAGGSIEIEGEDFRVIFRHLGKIVNEDTPPNRLKRYREVMDDILSLVIKMDSSYPSSVHEVSSMIDTLKEKMEK